MTNCLIFENRSEETVQKANDVEAVDLERPGGFGQRQQIQSDPQPHKHQEHQERTPARQGVGRLQGTCTF